MPCEAKTEAAPSVGPTHGLQTAPSSKPEQELAAETGAVEFAEARFGPRADRTRQHGETRLQLRNQQVHSERGRGAPWPACGKSPRSIRVESDRRDEHADRNEGNRQSGRERHWTVAMLTECRAEHDR